MKTRLYTSMLSTVLLIRCFGTFTTRNYESRSYDSDQTAFSVDALVKDNQFVIFPIGSIIILHASKWKVTRESTFLGCTSVHNETLAQKANLRCKTW